MGRDPDNSAEDPFEGVDLDDAFVRGATFREPAASERAQGPLPYLDLREDRINEQLRQLMDAAAREQPRQHLRTKGQFSVPWAILVVVVLGASFLWPRPTDEEQTTATPAPTTTAMDDSAAMDTAPDSGPGQSRRPDAAGSSRSQNPPPADELAAPAPLEPDVELPASELAAEEEQAGQAQTEPAIDAPPTEVAIAYEDAAFDDEGLEQVPSFVPDGARGLAGAPIPGGVVIEPPSVAPPSLPPPSEPAGPKAPDPSPPDDAAPPPKSPDDGQKKPGKKGLRDDRPQRDEDSNNKKKKRSRDRQGDKADREKQKPSKKQSDPAKVKTATTSVS